MPGLFVSNQKIIYSFWGYEAEKRNEFYFLNESFHRIETDLPKASLVGRKKYWDKGGRGIGIRNCFVPLSRLIILHEHWKDRVSEEIG